MNYCVVAFAIVFIISVVQWFVDGRKNYKGPVVDFKSDVLVAVTTADLRADAADDGSSSKHATKV
jgi:hypothetical protein